MAQHWCTYCDVGLAKDEQAKAHEDCGHVTHKVEYLKPSEDHRYQKYKEE
jgi:hypothetical protein